MKIEKEHRKKTLQNWSKAKLVEHIMCLEHNNNALHDTIDQQYENLKKLSEELEKKQVPQKVYDSDGYLERVNDEEYIRDCPCCGEIPISNCDSYCRHCGQALEFICER